MTKFANESAKGAARAAALRKPEKLYGNDGPTSSPKGQKVDPSVQLGPLQGEPRCCVPINSPAYTGKFPGYAK
jgi:hypothetical protein